MCVLVLVLVLVLCACFSCIGDVCMCDVVRVVACGFGFMHVVAGRFFTLPSQAFSLSVSVVFADLCVRLCFVLYFFIFLFFVVLFYLF